MLQSIQVGPLSVPINLLFLLIAVSIAMFMGKRAGRNTDIEVETHLFRILFAALLCARAAFVIQYWDAYISDPISIIDIRDGGWHPVIGIIAAWIYALIITFRIPAISKAVLTALISGSTIMIIGMIIMKTPISETTPLPDIALINMEGSELSLAQFSGKPTVVNLWATWCPPCRREMPVLERAQQDMPDVNFVFVNQGEARDEINHFFTSQGLILQNSLLDVHSDVGRHFHQSGLPATLFFNSLGQLTSVRIGELSHATLTQRLEKITSQ